MSDLTDRLDAVELAVAANQLPATFATLMRKLEQQWQPDADVLLEPGSITASLLDVLDSDGKGVTLGTFRARWGTTVFTFTASTDSAVMNVAHGLGKVPAAVSVNAWRKPGLNAGESHVGEPSAWTTTTFDCFGRATAAGAWTNTITVSWIAIG